MRCLRPRRRACIFAITKVCEGTEQHLAVEKFFSPNPLIVVLEQTMARRQPLSLIIPQHLNNADGSTSSGSPQAETISRLASASANVRLPIALVCDANILPTLRLFDRVDHFLRKRDHLHRNAELLWLQALPIDFRSPPWMRLRQRRSDASMFKLGDKTFAAQNSQK